MRKSIGNLYFSSIVQTLDDGFVTVGITYPVYDGLAWIVKINVSGDLQGEILIEPIEGINNFATSIVEANDGSYVFTGSKDSGNVWVVKIDQEVIPEFPLWTLLPIILIASLMILIAKKKIGG